MFVFKAYFSSLLTKSLPTVIFHAFFYCLLICFSRSTFSKYFRVSNRLDPDQVRYFVEPAWLGSILFAKYQQTTLGESNKQCLQFIVLAIIGTACKGYQQTTLGGIVRPVKRDWAVLSKDTPVDISM